MGKHHLLSHFPDGNLFPVYDPSDSVYRGYTDRHLRGIRAVNRCFLRHHNFWGSDDSPISCRHSPHHYRRYADHRRQDRQHALDTATQALPPVDIQQA